MKRRAAVTTATTSDGTQHAASATPRAFVAGDVLLESGETLHGASLAYCTFGTLNAAGDNAVLVPTHFGGTHEQSLYLFGRGRALDPDRHFIVVVNLIGNGVSISPSHGTGRAFPSVTIADNVRLQHRLLTEVCGVRSLALAVGHSMGAIQAYHLAAMFPDFVHRLAPICGAARVSLHNRVFLDGMKGILECAVASGGGRTLPPVTALRAMARAWAAWPPSAHFYRHRLFERLGYASVEDFLERYWEATYCGMDVYDVLAQIDTWLSADVGAVEPYGGDFQRALGAIRARAVVMPSETDPYFPPEDSALEVEHMPCAELRAIPSQWGHWAGSGRNPTDTAFIDRELAALLRD